MKEIYSLFILDRSGSMKPYRGRTIESINSNLETQREESKNSGIPIKNTLLTFAAEGGYYRQDNEKNMIFVRLNQDVNSVANITEAEYCPDGGTPLFDAIGDGIERLKSELGDRLGSDEVNIIVTIFTDGEENSSVRYDRPQIKKMIEHFSSDGKWTFTFVGCGSIDQVTGTSRSIGIDLTNTSAFANSEEGYQTAFDNTKKMYTNYVGSVTANIADKKNLFS